MSNLYTSENPKKKQCIIMYCIFLLPLLYIAISLSALTQIKIDVKHLSDSFVYVLTNVFLSEKINDKTMIFVFVGLLVWGMAFIFSYTKASMNLMHGEEHGTASWGKIKDFNKKYASPKEEDNKILSQSIRMMYDSKTLRNNNMFVVGGSGAGKTAFLVSPNLLQQHGSNIYTDPKGGLLADYGEFLKNQPNTRVYSVNLCDMDKSMCFNAFDYIREEADVSKLITNIIKNTTPEDASKGDPFWEQAESMYLESIFYYIWKCCPREEVDEEGNPYVLEKNFGSVLKLLDEAKIDELTKKTFFENRLDKLPDNHVAVRTYNRLKVAAKAEETVASIILCANSRFNKFDNPKLLRLLSKNEVPLEEIGTGINHDGKTKSFLFLIIPDDDDTYNFIPGMIYTLLFQELYYQARFYPKNQLPLDVGFWFDEFANIKMPSNFEKILATCRSRGIYCVPILQSLAQIKKLFKDGAWEGVVGNCDTFVYLGGNEQSSHKYVSELLGKWTIDKKTEGESKGSSGSSSKNYDVLGRDLLDASEMRLLPNDKEIVLLRGERPLIDRKWHPWEHEIHNIARSYGDYKLEVYERSDDSVSLIQGEELAFYERLAENSDDVVIHDIDLISFLTADFSSLDDDDDDISEEEFNALLEQLSETEVERIAREEKEAYEKKKLEEFMEEYDDMSLLDFFKSDYCDDKRRNIITELNQLGVSEENVKKDVAPDIPIEKVLETLKIVKSYYGK